jgi:hypothetical protein
VRDDFLKILSNLKSFNQKRGQRRGKIEPEYKIVTKHFCAATFGRT